MLIKFSEHLGKNWEITLYRNFLGKNFTGSVFTCYFEVVSLSEGGWKWQGAMHRNNGICMEILTSTAGFCSCFLSPNSRNLPSSFQVSHFPKHNKPPLCRNSGKNKTISFTSLKKSPSLLVFGFSPFCVRETLEGLPWHHGAWSAGSTPDPRLLPAHPTLVDGHKMSKDFKVSKTIVRNGVK